MSVGAGSLGLTHATEIVLSPTANILRLASGEDLDAFTEEYGFDPYSMRGGFIHDIRWPDIAAKYQGIIIAPYIWSRRMTNHTFWYYGWDCASGCIWEANAIEKLIPA